MILDVNCNMVCDSYEWSEYVVFQYAKEKPTACFYPYPITFIIEDDRDRSKVKEFIERWCNEGELIKPTKEDLDGIGVKWKEGEHTVLGSPVKPISE